MVEDDEDGDAILLLKPLRSAAKQKFYEAMSKNSSIFPRIHLKKVFLAILTLTVILILYYALRQSQVTTNNEKSLQPVRGKLKVPEFCQATDHRSSSQPNLSLLHTLLNSKTRSPGKVLIVNKTSYSKGYKSVTEILSAHRIGYKSTVAGKNLPDLIKVTKNVGKYGVIVFEDFRTYIGMDSWNRDLLDKYCQTYNVGIIAFVPLEEQLEQLADKSRKMSSLPKIRHSSKLRHVEIKDNSIIRLTKSGVATILDDNPWITFKVDEEKYYETIAEGNFNGTKETTVVLDKGKQDGIRKVLFSSSLNKHWLHKLLFTDALHFLSNGQITIALTRYILVDIDDVFVGSNRLKPDDVQALMESQKNLEQLVPGFKYNLGFSGNKYQSGSEEENVADEMLIEHSDKFWWFPHMWNHEQPHNLSTADEIIKKMEMNKNFSERMQIPVTNQYAIAPHHSGVYPVHEPLFQAWKRVWNIEVTSTEEYPHLRPAHFRRGFQHQGIKVLPRQTCGLFTKNLYYKDYPNGPEVLEKSIQGGELFMTIINNPISIFMTHQPNYGFDRLAPYTFESVVKMIKCWTNLDLLTKSPKEMADIYFNMFPEETAPIWGNPWDDKRHLEIWSEKKKKEKKLPDFLVIGPQKTGSTALYKFLQIHPAIMSNFNQNHTFEELQFFSNADIYAKGIDWYMDCFPPRMSANKSYLFEKSATYFDKDIVPKRAFRLLNNSKVILILISPSKRAYSWYQHMRAHQDPSAMEHSFYQVISTPANKTTKALKSLQSRCLEPGKYASHIERWLLAYKSQAQQFYIVDGEELKDDPISVMNRLQHFLHVQPFIDYSTMLKYEKNKGFYCPLVNGKTKCLGKGKGRDYPPMEPKSRKFLQNYYRLYNEHLLKLLKRLGYSIPNWLKEDLNDV